MSWRTSIIVLLHKKGDPTDVNNSRDIAISSCISKVLTKIMNQRIYKYCKENNLFSKNQSGFMEGVRKEDNIFTLNTIIDIHVKCKNQKRFAVFVNFSKFVHCISRNMLRYKLLQLGINKKESQRSFPPPLVLNRAVTLAPVYQICTKMIFTVFL